MHDLRKGAGKRDVGRNTKRGGYVRPGQHVTMTLRTVPRWHARVSTKLAVIGAVYGWWSAAAAAGFMASHCYKVIAE